jgi:uncharacterized protein HemY
MCSDAENRDPKQAIELAGKAVQNVPQEGVFWNTLGAAHFRDMNWKDCLAALEKSTQLRQGGDAFDWLFMAMAYHQTEESEEANRWLDKAVDWNAQMEQGKIASPLAKIQWQSQRRDAELLRREAEGLIRPKPEKGK